VRATVYPEPNGRQRVTVGGISVGYIGPVRGGWEARTLTGEHLAFEAGIVDAVRAVVAFSHPQIMVEVVEEVEA
jgi:hypothetical protein